MNNQDIIDLFERSGIVLRGCTYEPHKVIEFVNACVAAERTSRQSAQIENEALKARIARSGVEMRTAVAKAVRDEREACAKVCEAIKIRGEVYDDVERGFNGGLRVAAKVIRARGQADTNTKGKQ